MEAHETIEQSCCTLINEKEIIHNALENLEIFVTSLTAQTANPLVGVPCQFTWQVKVVNYNVTRFPILRNLVITFYLANISAYDYKIVDHWFKSQSRASTTTSGRVSAEASLLPKTTLGVKGEIGIEREYQPLPYAIPISVDPMPNYTGKIWKFPEIDLTSMTASAVEYHSGVTVVFLTHAESVYCALNVSVDFYDKKQFPILRWMKRLFGKKAGNSVDYRSLKIDEGLVRERTGKIRCIARSKKKRN